LKPARLHEVKNMSKRAILVLVAASLVLPLAILAGDPPDKGGVRPAADTPTSGPGFRPLTEQQETELMAALKDKDPENYKKLAELRESIPTRYRWALRGLWQWYQRYKGAPADLQKAMMDEQETRMATWRISRALGQAADPAEKTKLAAELRDALDKQFNAEQTLRECRLADLEQQIKHLREELDQRHQQREQILKDRMDDMIRSSTQPAPPREPGHEPGPGRDHRMGPPTRPAGHAPGEGEPPPGPPPAPAN
jgi:hypothetical protein